LAFSSASVGYYIVVEPGLRFIMSFRNMQALPSTLVPSLRLKLSQLLFNVFCLQGPITFQAFFFRSRSISIRLLFRIGRRFLAKLQF